MVSGLVRPADSQKPGLGFPLIRVVVLLTLATATLIDAPRLDP
jgi:hypothetical protein